MNCRCHLGWMCANHPDLPFRHPGCADDWKVGAVGCPNKDHCPYWKLADPNDPMSAPAITLEPWNIPIDEPDGIM